MFLTKQVCFSFIFSCCMVITSESCFVWFFLWVEKVGSCVSDESNVKIHESNESNVYMFTSNNTFKTRNPVLQQSQQNHQYQNRSHVWLHRAAEEKNMEPQRPKSIKPSWQFPWKFQDAWSNSKFLVLQKKQRHVYKNMFFAYNQGIFAENQQRTSLTPCESDMDT